MGLQNSGGKDNSIPNQPFAVHRFLRPSYQRIILCCGLLLLCSDHPPLEAEDRKILLAHYMPWYSSQNISEKWGWHWTMNHFDPKSDTQRKRRQIASHYYPLIGPYDSNDPHALECQVLLMKFAGIDGVIIDWYGITDHNDYATLHRNTNHLIAYIKKSGLRFAICYEDQSIKHMIEGGTLRENQVVAHGVELLSWMQENWFGTDAYMKVKGRPLLLVFGPQYFNTAQWEQLFSALTVRPHFYALNAFINGADGIFGWPPVHGGMEVYPTVWRQYLNDFYAWEEDGRHLIGTVFPKFHDIYAQAGVHQSYGYLDDQDGEVFAETLKIAWASKTQLIQLITWNDYGEGTIIEPTLEFGYRYLEMIQRYRQKQPGPVFPYSAEDLRLPVMLYKLRKRETTDNALATSLDRASAFMFSSNNESARELLLSAHNPVKSQ